MYKAKPVLRIYCKACGRMAVFQIFHQLDDPIDHLDLMEDKIGDYCFTHAKEFINLNHEGK